MRIAIAATGTAGAFTTAVAKNRRDEVVELSTPVAVGPVGLEPYSHGLLTCDDAAPCCNPSASRSHTIVWTPQHLGLLCPECAHRRSRAPPLSVAAVSIESTIS
jgi:hypothetical protein